MWTDVINLKVTELNSTSADILIGFYPYYHKNENFGNAIAHAYAPGRSERSGDIHMRADDPFSAFSVHGREFKMHCLFKVVCLSMCLCLLAYLSVCMSVCVSFRGVSLSVCCVQWRAEAVGCPGPTRFLGALENIFYSSRKISDDLFFISCQISGQLVPLMPPAVLHHAPVTTFFSSFFAICLHFLHKTGLLDTPQGGCPGRRTVRTPLHATGCVRLYVCLPVCLHVCLYMPTCLLVCLSVYVCLGVCSVCRPTFRNGGSRGLHEVSL